MSDTPTTKPLDHKATCYKCGGNKISMALTRLAYGNRTHFGGYPKDWEEVMWRECDRCGHGWRELPLDRPTDSPSDDCND